MMCKCGGGSHVCSCFVEAFNRVAVSYWKLFTQMTDEVVTLALWDTLIRRFVLHGKGGIGVDL